MTRRAAILAVAEMLSSRTVALRTEAIPAAVRDRCRDLLVDVAGLCIAARDRDYVSSLKGPGRGGRTAFGHAGSLDRRGASDGTTRTARIDDTFEGGTCIRAR